MSKAVIFDMDGVIVDTEYIFFATKTQMLIERGIDTDESYQHQFMGTSFDYMWRTMKEENHLEDSVSDLIAEMNHRREVMTEKEGIKTIKGVRELINFLKEKGYRLGVASSAPQTEILSNLEKIGLSEAFAIKLSGDEVVKPKPEPDVFLRVAELLEVEPSDCLVIEDSRNGSRAAKAAGMTCIGFANPDYPSQDLSVCDYLVTDFADSYSYFD